MYKLKESFDAGPRRRSREYNIVPQSSNSSNERTEKEKKN